MEPTTQTPPVERSLVTGGDPDERYPLPEKHAFKEAGEGVIEAIDLQRIGRALINFAEVPLGHLASLAIDYLWAEKGGSQGGAPCLGRTIKASKVMQHYSDVDYVVMLSVDHLRTGKATRWQVEALIGHALGHISVEHTEKGEDRLGIKGHDFEGFGFEFRRWGAYQAGMVAPAQAMAEAMQMGLFWAGSEEDSDEEEDAFDAAVEQAPGVEGELGPIAGGAPGPDWAEPFKDDPDMMELIDAGIVVSGDTPDDGIDVGSEEKRHLEAIRAEYGTRVLDDGSEVCRRCGIRASEHPIDVCAGGVPEKPLIPDAKVSSTNGQHDDALPLIDPDRVVTTLSQRGIQIAYQHGIGEMVGRYVHPVTGDLYSTAWAEAEYRGAISTTKREKVGAR